MPDSQPPSPPVAAPDLAARYVDVAALAWEETRFDGIQTKTLMGEDGSGMHTLPIRIAPGAVLPDHQHVRIEQTYVLEGSLVDDEGAATAGNFVWRPATSRHSAWTPDGCLLVAFFLQPNTFFDHRAENYAPVMSYLSVRDKRAALA